MNKLTENCINWIKEWFNTNGKDCNAIIGISGGKDSSVVAALCVEALGKDRVIGVLMPNGVQSDIEDSYKLVNFLGIKHLTVDISGIFKSFTDAVKPVRVTMSEQAKINLPPRIRMSLLYAIAQTYNGRVADTCNYDERVLGYFTLWGDGVGDFSPLGEFTVTQVKEIGRDLGLPAELVDKTPSDGLCGKTDEDRFGFTYEELEKCFSEPNDVDMAIKNKIIKRVSDNSFKQNITNIPTYRDLRP